MISFAKLPVQRRIICTQCRDLVFPDKKSDHKNHVVISPVSDTQLLWPSKLIIPLEDDKANAVK